MWHLRRKSPSVEDKARRRRAYDDASQFIKYTSDFFSKLTYLIIIASTIFVVGLVLLKGFDFDRAAFNLLCIAYGSLLAIQLARIAVGHNIAMYIHQLHSVTIDRKVVGSTAVVVEFDRSPKSS
jgi:hypothetical protein